MAQQTIGIGSAANDGTGDDLRTAGGKINDNFTELYTDKADGDDSRFTNSREWTAETVAQLEAETGTATTRRAWTAQRVRQAVIGWWNTVTLAISDVTGLQDALDSKLSETSGTALGALGAAAAADEALAFDASDANTPKLRTYGDLLTDLLASTGSISEDGTNINVTLPSPLVELGHLAPTYSVTLDDDLEFALPTNLVAGRTWCVDTTQNGVGGHSPTFAAGFVLRGTNTVAQTAGARTPIYFHCIDATPSSEVIDVIIGPEVAA